MAVYRDQAIVLRTQKLGEADRIITLLTRERGRIKAVAKGVRKTKSRWGAKLEPTSHVDLQLYEGRTLDTITQAVSIEHFGDRLIDDYGIWTISSAMLETAERFTANEHEPALQQYTLLAAALKALANRSYTPTLILDAYLLRSLAIAGYAPALLACSICERPGPHKYFSLAGGGSVCPDCKNSVAATVSPEALELMSALISGDWTTAESIADKVRSECSGIIAAYLQFHLERGMKSFALVERKARGSDE